MKPCKQLTVRSRLSPLRAAAGVPNSQGQRGSSRDTSNLAFRLIRRNGLRDNCGEKTI